MSIIRINDAALGGVFMLACLIELVGKGFPHGGIAFAASVAFFRLAARGDA